MPQGLPEKSKRQRNLFEKIGELHRRNAKDHRRQATLEQCAINLERWPQKRISYTLKITQLRLESLQLCQSHHLSLRSIGIKVRIFYDQLKHGLLQPPKINFCMDKSRYSWKSRQDIPCHDAWRRIIHDSQHTNLPQAMAQMRLPLFSRS